MKRAIILAGGLGTRLKPYTVSLPKPLMPVGKYPILEIVIRQLANAGFSHITLAVNHQADIIKAFFQSGEKWGVKIDYSLETERLGTMGPLTIINDLPENFLVMNGDVLTNISFDDLYQTHIQSKCNFTIASKKREQVNDYGVLDVLDNKLIGFREKPISTYQVSMGVYILSRKVMKYMPAQKYFGFDELMLKMLSNGDAVNIYDFKGDWLDIGRPDDYEVAIDEFEDNERKYNL
ncbi:sugar phosphate nucleotidyltransferase [Moritella sp. 5]|uniref:sugar phosphate nucleotidyltransferase n=1 Tax=Moritella sp. 5 TaxID=2746231 RepID=UPI001BA5111C|nr:sugar phosphate nucleotidyltransferase [Moritella sp. 5]